MVINQDTDKLPSALQQIVNLYVYEPLDAITIQHLNGHAQSVVPGPYKFYIAEETLSIAFFFDDPKELTWWMLKYS